MGFGLSLINCSKTAPFLTAQWVSDHEGSTVGVGVGQSNNSFFPFIISYISPVIRFSGDFFYFKRRIIYIMLFFYLLDKWCELVYTSSVVNREVIRNVVTNFDMVTQATPDEVSDSIKE